MAWSISISPEGWQDIRRELETWDRERIIAALADDAYEAAEEANNDDDEVCELLMRSPGKPLIDPKTAAEVCRKSLAYLSDADLVDLAVERIEENNTCDNGGFRYWIDRQGYHGVTLS